MFENLESAPPDPILGLNAAFGEDANPNKVNLGVGEYRDGQGQTPIFDAVSQAQRRILSAETTKAYLPIDGTPEYGHAVRQLLFGDDGADRQAAVTVQAPGGTGALRLAADFLHRLFPDAGIWISEPTWANHPKVFEAAGVRVGTYAYFDSDSDGLDFDAMLGAIGDLPSGDAILLHGCCHNPTGVDPDLAQWKQIGDALADREVVPVVDFAYQGLGDGLAADAAGLRELSRPRTELFVASSFSKNFGLYKERTGALTVLSGDADAAASVISHLKVCARTSFSNPPAHGSAIVTEILRDADLRRRWEEELSGMRDRINGMRRLLVSELNERGVTADFSFIERQRGMFSFTGLTPEQVGRLRDEYSIYIVGSGRINVAGLTEANIGGVCDALAAVL